MTARVLVFGARGQVARELARAPAPAGFEVVVRGRGQVDIRDRDSVATTVRELAPAVVVNAAAYTAVDAAEDDAATAFAVNADGAGHVAAAARAAGCPVVHLSTDYVFDGAKPAPYTEADPIAPLGVYGRSKAAGEDAVRDAQPSHVILRTAWVYSPFGQNFVRTMLRVGAERDRLTVVDDQVGTPTAAGDIAAAVCQVSGLLLARPAEAISGTYHLAGAGAVSWYGFAREIFRQAEAIAGGPAPEVAAIPSSQWPTRASRPANSRLSSDRYAAAFGWAPAAWPISLNHVITEILSVPDDTHGAPGNG